MRLFSATLAVSLITSASGYAAGVGSPAYLHALRDLKDATSEIEARGGDAAMKPHERNALVHIRQAIEIVDRAATDDHKNDHSLPAADTTGKSSGDLHKAMGYLDKAQGDLNEAESDKASAPLRRNASNEVYEARSEIQDAIKDYQGHK